MAEIKVDLKKMKGISQKDAEMIADAWWFWFTHSHLTVGRSWSARAFAQLDSTPSLLCLWLNALTGWFAEAVGEFETALAMHQRGLAIAREFGDPATLGIALYALAAFFGCSFSIRCLSLG